MAASLGETATCSPRSLELAQRLHESLQHELQSFVSGCTSSVGAYRDSLLSLERHIQDNVLTCIRMLLNATSPVNKLPPEVLANIFSSVPDEWVPVVSGPGTSSWERMSNVKQLRPLTAVCRSWRAVCIGTPSLWSTIMLCQDQNPETPWYQTCLERSTHGHLDVYADVATRGGVTKFLLENGSRIRDLCLVYQFTGQDSMIYGPMQLALSTPNLERCTISGGHIVYSSLRPRNPPFALFPRSPRLRRLRLLSCDFIPSTPFPELTHLCVAKCSARLEDLLALISRAPHLQVLKFYLGGPARMWLDIPALQSWRARTTVVLPQLRELELVDHLPTMFTRDDLEIDPNNTLWYNILSSIPIPPACTIRLGAIAPHHLRGTLDHLGVGSRATHAYFEKGWPYCGLTKAAFYLHALNQAEHLDAVVGVSHGKWMPLAHIRSQLWNAFASFASLRRLRMHLDIHNGPAAVAPLCIFHQLPALEFLALFSSDNNGIYAPCTELLPLTGLVPVSGQPMCCPHLSILFLNLTGSPNTTLGEGELAYVLNFARSRTAAGAPIAQLMLCERDGEEPVSDPVPASEGDAAEPAVAGGAAPLLQWNTVPVLDSNGNAVPITLMPLGVTLLAPHFVVPEPEQPRAHVEPANTVLREYNAAGERVRTHEDVSDPYAAAERMWAEGLDWHGSSGDWKTPFEQSF